MMAARTTTLAMTTPTINTSGEVVGPEDVELVKGFVCDAAALGIVLVAGVVDLFGVEVYDIEA